MEMSVREKQQKKLLRLISAFSDMANSVSASDLLLSGDYNGLYHHLFLSMVIAYGRPFFESNGVGRVQCDYPNYPDFGDSEMRDRHSRLLDIRNKFLAHSSAEGTRILIVPPGVPNPLGRAPQTIFEFNIGKRKFCDIEFVRWLRVAPVEFRQHLHSDIHQLLEQI